MTGRERGFLLLTSRLGNPHRPVLSPAQLRTLAARVTTGQVPREDRQMQISDLVALGYGTEFAARILQLLSEEALLERYLRKAARLECIPVTRVTDGYPQLIRRRLGTDCPGTLWARGDISLLNRPAVSLVGSRDLRPENRAFAEAVGRYAAGEGLVLVSGNARGADRTAQDACLAAGGRVISIVADELWKQPVRENLLYLSEEEYDAPFTAARALSRNRCIHTLGRMVFVAQAGLRKGGTWDGTAKNLRCGWSNVVCFRDGSEAGKELQQMGAFLIGTEELKDFTGLAEEITFL